MSARTVGIREFRQNAGRLIREVNRTGGTVVITDRGEPVATLGPAPQTHMSVFDRLVRAGKVQPATGTIEDVAPSSWMLPEKPTEVLREMRGER